MRAKHRYAARLETLAQELGVPLEIVGPHDPVPQGATIKLAERCGERARLVGWPLGVALGVSLLVVFL